MVPQTQTSFVDGHFTGDQLEALVELMHLGENPFPVFAFQNALDALPGSFTVIQQRVDTAAAFAAGGILITAAMSLSLWWNRPRTPAR